MEEEDVWVYVNGVLLLFVLGESSLLQDFLDGIDVAINSGVGYIHRLYGNDLGLLYRDAFFNRLWISKEIVEALEVVWSRFDEVA